MTTLGCLNEANLSPSHPWVYFSGITHKIPDIVFRNEYYIQVAEVLFSENSGILKLRTLSKATDNAASNTLHVFHWNIITGTLVRHSSEKYHPNYILPCTFTGYSMLKRKGKHQSRAHNSPHIFNLQQVPFLQNSYFIP
jgi:hypothetical protein